MIIGAANVLKCSSDEEEEWDEFNVLMDCVFCELMDKVAKTYTLQSLQENEVRKALEAQFKGSEEMDNTALVDNYEEEWQNTMADTIVKIAAEMLNMLLCFQHGIIKSDLEKIFYTFLDEYIKLCEDTSSHKDKEKLLFQFGKSLEDIIAGSKIPRSYQ